MDTYNLWKKLNAIVKTGTPLAAAHRMVDSGEITRDEIAWVVTTLALLPIRMMEVLDKK